MFLKYDKVNAGALLVFLQNIIYFLYLYTRSYSFLAMFFVMIFPLIFMIEFKRKYIAYYVFIVFSFIIFFIVSFFSREYDYFISWYNLLYAVAALVAAYFFVNSDNGLVLSKISFYMYAIFLAYFIFKLGADGAAYNEILEGSSRNYLSAISIFLTINIYIQIILRKENLILFPAFLNLILCLSLFGRSGIALSFIIFMYVCYIKDFKLFISFLILIFSLLVGYLSILVSLLNERSNFAIGLESERSIFRKEYLFKIFESNDFLTGRKLSECCTLIQSFGNPHNSFIMGHLRYGVAHTILSILIVIFVLFKKKFVLLFFMLIIYSRYFLDQLGLFAFFDFVLFSLLFVTVIKKNTNKFEG